MPCQKVSCFFPVRNFGLGQIPSWSFMSCHSSILHLIRILGDANFVQDSAYLRAARSRFSAPLWHCRRDVHAYDTSCSAHSLSSSRSCYIVLCTFILFVAARILLGPRYDQRIYVPRVHHLIDAISVFVSRVYAIMIELMPT